MLVGLSDFLSQTNLSSLPSESINVNLLNNTSFTLGSIIVSQPLSVIYSVPFSVTVVSEPLIFILNGFDFLSPSKNSSLFTTVFEDFIPLKNGDSSVPPL